MLSLVPMMSLMWGYHVCLGGRFLDFMLFCSCQIGNALCSFDCGLIPKLCACRPQCKFPSKARPSATGTSFSQPGQWGSRKGNFAKEGKGKGRIVILGLLRQLLQVGEVPRGMSLCGRAGNINLSACHSARYYLLASDVCMYLMFASTICCDETCNV